MKNEIFTKYLMGDEIEVSADIDDLDKMLDKAIIDYMKQKKISTLDIIATETIDERDIVTTNIVKDNMRVKGEN